MGRARPLALVLAICGSLALYADGVDEACGLCGVAVSEAGALPKGVPAMAASPPHYGSCAVVMASSLLLKFEHGPAIDEHDAVFRLNKHSPWKFEEFVGRRTTVRIVNSQHNGKDEMLFTDFMRDNEVAFLRDWSPKAESLAAWKKQSREKFNVFKTLLKAKDDFPSRRIFLLARKAMRAVGNCTDNEPHVDVSTKTSPTSGMLAVFLARQMCDSVTVFGAGCPECGYYAPRRRSGKKPSDPRAKGAAQYSTEFGTNKKHDLGREVRILGALSGLTQAEMEARGMFVIEGCTGDTQSTPAVTGKRGGSISGGASGGASGGGDGGVEVVWPRLKSLLSDTAGRFSGDGTTEAR